MAIDIGTVDYNQAIAAVANYYQTDPGNVINIVNDYGLTPEQLYQTLPTTDNIWNVTYSNSGAILGTDTVANIQYAGATQAAEAAAAMNSNVATASQATKTLTNVPAQTTIDSQSGNVIMSRGATSAATGNTFLAIADKISLGVVGVSIGTKLGAFIDSTIYNAAPDYWDEVFPTINPQTWDTLATTSGGQQFIRGLFGISGNESGMYIPEDVFAYYALAMAKEGFFTLGDAVIAPTDLSKLYYPNNPMPYTVGLATSAIIVAENGTHQIVCNNPMVMFRRSDTPYGLIGIVNTSTAVTIYHSNSPGRPENYTIGPSRRTKANNQYGYFSFGFGARTLSSDMPVLPQPPSGYTENLYADIAEIAFYSGNVTRESYPGVTPQPGVTYPAINPNSNVEDVLAQLKTLYPDLWDKALSETVVQPDGTTKTYTYVPMPVTETSNLRDPQPTNTTVPQDGYIVDPTTTPQDILDTITRYLTGTQQSPDGDTVPLDPTENPPDTGDGDTPDVVLPVGNASALWSVYNPTLAEINAFGSWLWSSNFIDQLLKMFNDPMQSIIGLHKIFVPPVIGNVSNIVVGYLDSGVPANTVPTQYASLDCGSINLLEYFGNVFDYTPFTRVYIYLPFIGFRELDTALVMRSTLNVTYHADVYTGAGLAEVSAIRDSGSGGVVYQFSCDLAAKYPLSQGSYMGIVSSIASLAAGVLSGNPVITASSAINAISSSKTKTEMSGSFTGNSGALGIKKPYLVIIRPQTRMADQYPTYDGVPANYTSRLADCTGYVKVKEVHLKVPNAYKSEILEIEQMLHDGVLI